MAERATPERVASDMSPPKFRQAVQRLRTIKPKKERIAGINGEIGGIFDAIEGFKVNKKAAKIFMALDGLEPSEQQDIFRSLMGLIDSAEWGAGDLVDRAEGGDGNIVRPQFGRRSEQAEEDDGGLTEALAGVETPAAASDDESAAEPAASDDGAANPKPKRRSPKAALDAAKAAFEAGKAPDTAPPVETYTGDNADLNPGGDEE